MFISTGGVYQRRFHLREVLKGGIYISFIRGIMVEVYCEARLCLQKCSLSEGLFVLGGGRELLWRTGYLLESVGTCILDK